MEEELCGHYRPLTEVAKRQVTDVACKKSELVQRNSTVRPKQKALPGSDGIEDVEFVYDAAEKNKSGRWKEFFAYLFGNNIKNRKLARLVKRKCVLNEELTVAEYLELISSGNIKLLTMLIGNLKHRLVPELEKVLLKKASTSVLVAYLSKFSLDGDSLLVLFHLKNPTVLKFYFSKYRLTDESLLVQLDDTEVFKIYIEQYKLRLLGQKELFNTGMKRGKELFRIYFHQYGMEGFDDSLKVSAAIGAGDNDYVARKIERTALTLREQQLLVVWGDVRLIRLHIHIYGMVKDELLEMRFLERQDNDLILCYLEKTSLLPRTQALLIENGDSTVVQFHIRLYGLWKDMFKNREGTLYSAGYLESLLIKRGNIELLEVYLEKAPLESNAQSLLVQVGDSSLIKLHIEKYGLDKKLESKLIERGNECLLQCYIEKTPFEPEMQELLVEKSDISVILAHILKYGLVRTYSLENKLLKRGNSDLIRTYCTEKPFDAAIETRFILTGVPDDIEYYIKKFGLAEGVPTELIRRGDVALFEVYVKEHELTIKEQAYLLGFGKMELLLNYIYYHRLSVSGGLEKDFLRNFQKNITDKYREKYNVEA